MVTTELGACEWFVWDLRRSNLLDRGQLDQVVSDFLSKNPRAEPSVLAEYLIGQGILTKFQADRLLQGKTQGFVLGPYTLMDALGTGSMGTVYKALSKTDNHWYAVKVLPRRSMWNVRIARRKVRSFEQCRHPAVVPFIDVGTTGGMHYLSWPLVEGENLEQLVKRQGKLTPEQAALFALQVCEGLEVCQKEGLIHGLLKPSNLMLGPDNQVRILDFGIGCLLAESEGESLVDTMSTANSVASGLDCASPESIMDPTNLTSAGDLYSLGCILYYWLTGRYPFPDGSAAEKMMAHQLKQPESIQSLSPDVPDEFVEVVQRLMQKNPDGRFRNATEVIEALRPFAPSSPTSPLALIRARQLREHGLEPVRLSGPATGDPSRSGAPRHAPPALPNREMLRGSGAPPVPAVPRAVAPPSPPANPPEAAREPAPSVSPDRPRRSWEERMGPLGIAIGAIILCVLAWLLTWHLF